MVKETKVDIEELITQASNHLQPLVQPQEGVFFDSVAFRKSMRLIKRELDRKMRNKGISIMRPGETTLVTAKFKDICLSLREITISHGSQGNYGLELEACVELTDLLSGLEDTEQK